MQSGKVAEKTAPKPCDLEVQEKKSKPCDPEAYEKKIKLLEKQRKDVSLFCRFRDIYVCICVCV